MLGVKKLKKKNIEADDRVMKGEPPKGAATSLEALDKD